MNLDLPLRQWVNVGERQRGLGELRSITPSSSSTCARAQFPEQRRRTAGCSSIWLKTTFDRIARSGTLRAYDGGRGLIATGFNSSTVSARKGMFMLAVSELVES